MEIFSEANFWIGFASGLVVGTCFGAVTMGALIRIVVEEATDDELCKWRKP